MCRRLHLRFRLRQSNENLKRRLGIKDAMNYFRETEATKRQPSLKPIFEGVKVYVAKNLLNDQVKLYQIVASLGGDFSWTHSEDWTHFIYKGKLSDANKELEVAKQQGETIVRPSWLYDCQKQVKHVDEHQHLISNLTSMITATTVETLQKMSSIESDANFITCNGDESENRLEEPKEHECMSHENNSKI